MRSFHQDRLGTNIGKGLRNGYCFLAGAGYYHHAFGKKLEKEVRNNDAPF
jgi:hypothetical protein